MKVFITGGSGGLGFEIVKKLSNLKNIQLFATYNNSTAHKSIDLQNVRFIKIDFTENNFLEKIKEHLDDIDCLINNYSTGYEFKHLTSFKSDDVLNSFNNNIAPLIDINNFYQIDEKKVKWTSNFCSFRGYKIFPSAWYAYIYC